LGLPARPGPLVRRSEASETLTARLPSLRLLRARAMPPVLAPATPGLEPATTPPAGRRGQMQVGPEAQVRARSAPPAPIRGRSKPTRRRPGMDRRSRRRSVAAETAADRGA